LYNIIIPATIIAITKIALTAIPAIAPPVNPLLSVLPRAGVAVIVPEVAPTAVPVAVFVPVPVLVTLTDSEVLVVVLVLLVVVLPILVENTEGVEPGTVVLIDPLGNAL